jgi:hypothetical protein
VERSPDGTATGRLWRADSWLRGRLPAGEPPDLGSVSRELAAFGLTSVCDATPDLDDAAIALLARARESGALAQRVQLLGAPLQQKELPAGLAAGPYKIVIADSELPDIDCLMGRIRSARIAHRPVAVHCVTREALVLLLAALDGTGSRPGDRVEHAAMVPAELIGELASRGLRVVTQPGFLTDRGEDYLRDIEQQDHGDLYRCGNLVAAGIPVALSSDAPFGPLDPWAVMAAAIHRRAASGVVVGPDERMSASQALMAYLASPEDPGGRPRRVCPGSTADLVLLDRGRAALVEGPSADAVRMTLIAGRVVAVR